MSGGCSPLVPGVFSFQPFEMMAPSWLYFLTVAWGQGGTDHISVAESAAVLNTFLLPCSCCCLPVPVPVPVAIPISSVPCFSFTQLGATDLTYTEPMLCALCTQQGSVAPWRQGAQPVALLLPQAKVEAAQGVPWMDRSCVGPAARGACCAVEQSTSHSRD